MARTSDTLVIERLVVEGGFLDGLDLRFTEGMNVLIGERGAGNSSVIELLRFALGTPALTERFARLAREHTASVLGDGRVSVSYMAGGERRRRAVVSVIPSLRATHRPHPLRQSCSLRMRSKRWGSMQAVGCGSSTVSSVDPPRARAPRSDLRSPPPFGHSALSFSHLTGISRRCVTAWRIAR